MTSRTKIVFIALFTLTSIGFGQVKYSNEFLNIGVGVRSAGMGNSVVASTNDITAGYWNPASLIKLENNIELGYQHSELFAGVANYDYGGMSFKIDDFSTAGFSYIRSGVDDIPDTRNLIDANGDINYDRIQSFSSIDDAFMFHYARKVGPPPLSIGGSVKIVRRKVGEFANAIGFGVDLSAFYELEKVNLGLNFRDISGTWNAWNFNKEELEEIFLLTNNEVPQNSIEITVPQMVVGGGYMYQINDKFSFYPELNLSITFDGKRNTLIKSDFASIDPRFGVEASYQKIIFLRAGINGFQKVATIDDEEKWYSSPGIGVGVNFEKVAIDYALTNIGGSSGFYTNSFFIRFEFNKRK
tara:strand:+ start:1964 stop:3031 length:1068 start_codon:yes stop_codon:yes gene_type:complete